MNNKREQVEFEGQLHFNNGGKVTENPYVKYTKQSEDWATGFGIASDRYMDQPGRALDPLETTGDSDK